MIQTLPAAQNRNLGSITDSKEARNTTVRYPHSSSNNIYGTGFQKTATF
jgi:hypothetical protein